MSILDFGFENGADLTENLEAAAPIIEQLLDQTGLASDDVIQKVKDGISPYIAYGLTNEHLDALFAAGINFVQAGEIRKAQNMFLKLTSLKSTDARFNYALGTTLQMQQNYAAAAKIYMIALSLDAMHVDGYLRVGECLLASKEHDRALEAFTAAQSLCEHGTGSAASRDLANRMVEHVRDLVENQP